MPKAIVTGGAGFIGSHMTDFLIKKGYKVVVIDNLRVGKRKNLNPKAKFYKKDIKNRKAIFEIFRREKPDYIFHYAAQIFVRFSVTNPVEDAEDNIIGGLNLIEASRRFKVKKMIFVSSAAVYGEKCKIPLSENCPPNPVSPYGVAKFSFEKYLDCYGSLKKDPLNYAVVRYANVYGPRQYSGGESGVIAIFTERFLKNKQPIINGDGKNTRDYVYVGDVINATWLALRKKTKNKIFNVGTGKRTSVNQIFNKLKKATSSKLKAKHGAAKAGEERHSALDTSRARRELGWKPKMNLDKGLQKTVDWFRD